METFYLTFGLKYTDEPHPTYPFADPYGFITITTEDYNAARWFAERLFGTAWAFLYTANDFKPGYHPKGLLAEFIYVPHNGN